MYKFYYWDKFKIKILNSLKNKEFDLVIAHEIRLVPLALKIAKNPVILDADEYSPKILMITGYGGFLLKNIIQSLL